MPKPSLQTSGQSENAGAVRRQPGGQGGVDQGTVEEGGALMRHRAQKQGRYMARGRCERSVKQHEDLRGRAFRQDRSGGPYRGPGILWSGGRGGMQGLHGIRAKTLDAQQKFRSPTKGQRIYGRPRKRLIERFKGLFISIEHTQHSAAQGQRPSLPRRTTPMTLQQDEKLLTRTGIAILVGGQCVGKRDTFRWDADQTMKTGDSIAAAQRVQPMLDRA